MALVLLLVALYQWVSCYGSVADILPWLTTDFTAGCETQLYIWISGSGMRARGFQNETNHWQLPYIDRLLDSKKSKICQMLTTVFSKKECEIVIVLLRSRYSSVIKEATYKWAHAKLDIHLTERKVFATNTCTWRKRYVISSLWLNASRCKN